MRKLIKNNIKVLIAFGIGIILAGTGVYAATVIAGTSVSYSNTTSGLTSTNVQSAIDELYQKTDIRKQGNFVAAYTYNQTSGASNYCVTGNEETCVKSDCYKTKTANSCKAGDIILYKVNDTTIVPFHVMFDNGSTMTMQSQKHTIYDTAWSENTDNYSTEGPLTALFSLENATAGWSNVNNQTYTMGTTVFKDNAYTGCETIGGACYENVYTLESRTAKARMITAQEAFAFGCIEFGKSCPIWMNNYLINSTSNGGTVNDKNSALLGSDGSNGYWTMSASSIVDAMYISVYGYLSDSMPSDDFKGVRAVVVVNK